MFKQIVNFFVTMRHVSARAWTINSEEGLDTDPVGQSDPAKGGILELTDWRKPPAALGRAVGFDLLCVRSYFRGSLIMWAWIMGGGTWR